MDCTHLDQVDVLKDSIRFIDRNQSILPRQKVVFAMTTMLALCSPQDRKYIWSKLSGNRRAMQKEVYEDEIDFIRSMHERGRDLI